MRYIHVLVLSTVFIGALAFSGCGGGNEKDVTPTSTNVSSLSTPVPTTSTSPQPTSAAPTAAPVSTGTLLDKATFGKYEIDNVKYGGTVTKTLSFALGSLDPKFLTGSPIYYFLHWSSEKLVAWVPNENDILSHLEPNLAERWSASSDLKTYTFNLRKGVKWQNIAPVNGRELVASDIVYNINRFQEKDAVTASYYSAIASAEAPDKYTVVIKLKEPNAWALNDLFGGPEYMMAPEFVKESGGQLPSKIIGTGPYILKDFVFRQGATYVRNPDYWGKDKNGKQLPYADTISDVFMSDIGTITAGVRTHQLDIASPSAQSILALTKSNPDLRYFVSGLPNFSSLAFNTKKAPWDDVRVRRAFNMAMDKDAAGRALSVTGNLKYGGPLPGFLIKDGDLTLEDFGPYYKYNLAESKKLLIEAGYKDGKFKITGGIEFGDSSYYTPFAQVMQQQLKANGIEVELVTLTGAAYFTKWFLRTYEDMTMNHTLTGDYTLNWYAQNKYRLEGSHNPAFIRGPEIDKVISEIKVTTDPAKHKQQAKVLWDFDTLGSYNIWFPQEPGFAVTSARTRNYIVRTGGDSFTGGVYYYWLADATRNAP